VGINGGNAVVRVPPFSHGLLTIANPANKRNRTLNTWRHGLSRFSKYLPTTLRKWTGQDRESICFDLLSFRTVLYRSGCMYIHSILIGIYTKTNTIHRLVKCKTGARERRKRKTFVLPPTSESRLRPRRPVLIIRRAVRNTYIFTFTSLTSAPLYATASSSLPVT